jgi:hypothetical protein
MCVLLQISVQCQDRALPLLYSFLALHPPETRPSSLLFTLLCVNTIGSSWLETDARQALRNLPLQHETEHLASPGFAQHLQSLLVRPLHVER